MRKAHIAQQDSFEPLDDNSILDLIKKSTDNKVLLSGSSTRNNYVKMLPYTSFYFKEYCQLVTHVW